MRVKRRILDIYMGKNIPPGPALRIPCGLCATAKCQGDAGNTGKRWPKTTLAAWAWVRAAAAAAASVAASLSASFRGAREAAAASTSARRAASACFSAAVAARFDDLTTAPARPAAPPPAAHWWHGRRRRPSSCRRTVARLSFCAAAAAAAALLAALSAMHLACFSSISCPSEWRCPALEWPLEQRCPAWTATSAAVLRAPATAVDVRPHVQRQSVDVDDRNAGRQCVEGQLQLFLTSLFAEVICSSTLSSSDGYTPCTRARSWHISGILSKRISLAFRVTPYWLETGDRNKSSAHYR